ncbi:MAG: lytic transglycosylase domain-containing protein [Gemmatimonadales bacterium]|nr:lytic transglycosylase domain-containing protein [Gemmatimonadales bacterium]
MSKAGAPTLVVRLVAAALVMATGSPSLQAQSSLDDVQAALRNGQSFRATQLVAPLLTSPRTRTPEALILAAEAAAGWEGWNTVQRLLNGEPWLDGRFDRLGRRLLAEAALANGERTLALEHARSAVEPTLMPREGEERARRLVLLARTHEQMEQWDSAARHYHAAAELVPQLRDWLLLRAAGVTRDSATRARDYSRITLVPARQRIGPTEALIWQRLDEKGRAARSYAASGAAGSALRMRWEATTDADERATIVRELLALARQTGNATHAREALEMLERYNPPLSRDDHLFIARRAATLGRNAQAAALFARLDGASGLESEELFLWAEALAGGGDWSAAARIYRRITTGPRAAQAAYGAARADLRAGNSSAAIRALEQLIAAFPDDLEGTGNALYLLGDLALDAGRPDSARVLFRRLASNHAKSTFGQRGALLAPLIAHAQGQHKIAESELAAALDANRLTGLDAEAGRYWLGRIRERLGDRAAARAAWRGLLARGPESYYAVRAAARLDTVPWSAPPPASLLPVTTLDALARHDLLDRWGLNFEAGLELDHLVRSTTSVPAMLSVGEELLAAGHASLATQLGRRALAAGARRDGLLWQLLYPLPYEDALRAAAAREGVDPYLAASLIRQESAFVPRATSRTDARGLMQVMPNTGRALAGTFNVADFDPAMLWIPDLNLTFGMRHVAEALARYPERERALAAYNAGDSRVVRWSRTLLSGPSDAASTTPLDDVELFVERIPFVETRGYIRAIIRNMAVYEMIYGKR